MGSVRTGSSPDLSTIYGPLAQLVEQVTLNHFVGGSNPSRSTIYSHRLMVKTLGSQPGNESSILSGSTTC